MNGPAGRAALVWLLIVLIESVHGPLRRLYLEPAIGEVLARQVSVFNGSVLIFAVALLTIRWIGARDRAGLLRIGAGWVAATFVFEVGLGLATGASWARIGSDYDLAHGGLMPLGMLAMGLSPLAAARIRHLV